jgi:hypothetical protein
MLSRSLQLDCALRKASQRKSADGKIGSAVAHHGPATKIVPMYVEHLLDGVG